MGHVLACTACTLSSSACMGRTQLINQRPTISYCVRWHHISRLPNAGIASRTCARQHLKCSKAPLEEVLGVFTRLPQTPCQQACYCLMQDMPHCLRLCVHKRFPPLTNVAQQFANMPYRCTVASYIIRHCTRGNILMCCKQHDCHSMCMKECCYCLWLDMTTCGTQCLPLRSLLQSTKCASKV